MIIFGFVLYILLVVLLGVSALVYLSPVVIGLGIIIIANIVSKVKRGKIAPVLWNVITVGITVFTTGILWKDIVDDAVDTGPLPFIILATYGIISLAFLAMPKITRKQKVYKEVILLQDLPKKTQKRIRTSRVVAIVCTVMAGIGLLIAMTGAADINESMPPTGVFVIVAIICWAIVGKKHYKKSVESISKQITDEFALRMSEEYKKVWDEDLKNGLKKNAKNSADEEYDWKLEEIWEDYPAPNYDAIHTYCEVAFDDSGRTYYYRTRNPELQAGDVVYVPFGQKDPKRIGIITNMEDYAGHNVPFPLEKTKFVIGKVE